MVPFGENAGCATYGGLKNCSMSTHIPLIISVIKKYFPALFNAPSDPGESHCFGAATRKPAGGGPIGRALRRVVVEKEEQEEATRNGERVVEERRRREAGEVTVAAAVRLSAVICRRLAMLHLVVGWWW